MKHNNKCRTGWGLKGLTVALATGVALGGCQGRERTSGVTKAKAIDLDLPAVVEIDLRNGLPEVASTTLFGPSGRSTYAELIQALRNLRSSDTSKGFFIRLGMSRMAFARAHELGRILGQIRKDGRTVVCHADEYNNATLLLAAVGCSKVWVSPAGSVDSVGIAAQLLFAKKLLDKLNVDVDFLQVGKFKGANEMFTRETVSPEARQSLEGALGGIRTAWMSATLEGRGNEHLADLLEDGPFIADEAKSKGLVDEVGDLDEAREDAKKLAGTEFMVKRFGGPERDPGVGRSLVDVFRTLSGASSIGTPHVSLVAAAGPITMSTSGVPFGSSDGIGERELGSVIARLTKDETTKAVILRIDSPGGSALAADLLWKKLMKLREKKPVVVSIGSMAASGGYYLACTGSKIFSEATSIIGSIGVVGGKLAFGRTLSEVGITFDTIGANPDPQRASRAAYMSALTPWDDATREKVLVHMQAIYDLFLKRVSEGRGVGIEAITPSAEGQVFAGLDAKQRGLVDEIGGLEDAIKQALDLAKLPSDAPIEIEREDSGLLDLLAGVDSNGDEGLSAERQPRHDAFAKAAEKAAKPSFAPRWLGVMSEIDSFVGSMSPLVMGERALTALPFVLMIQ